MAHRPSNRRRNEWAVSLLDVQPTDRVLEIGFGPGRAIAELSRRSERVYGIDVSAEMLRQASRRNAAAVRSGRVTLRASGVEALPFDGPFDVILAVNSLGFWTEPAVRLADLRRRLAPGGRIAIVSQPRAVKATPPKAAVRLTALLEAAGFPETRFSAPRSGILALMRTPLAAAAILLALPASAGAQTVYSSLPLQGYSRSQTQAVVAGARLALKDSGAPLKYVSLDDSTRRTGAWAPSREQANARRGAQDAAAIAYIGAFNSGASAISIPILNEAGVPMISPANTAVGLTRGGPGANPREPDKYYPTGVRTYFRLTPNDAVQGGALAAATRDRGCAAIALVTDREVYGKGVGAWFGTYAQSLGLNVVASKSIHRQRSYRGLARSLKGADCFVYTGITANGAVALFRDAGRALPKAKLFGSDGIAESGFSRHIPRSVARRVLVSVDTLAPDAYPTAGQAVLARAGKHADPYFLYGYEAMRLVADAYAGGARDKAGVLAYLRGVTGRAGVIGTYGFDANGDTTLKTFGLYGIRGGLFSWAGVVTAP